MNELNERRLALLLSSPRNDSGFGPARKTLVDRCGCQMRQHTQ